jgi:hypothetical protein
MKKLFLLATIACASFIIAKAQTAEEIIEKYVTVTGGKEAILKNKSYKMEGKVKVGSMDIPIVILRKGGKQKTSFTFNGMTIVQGAFDGAVSWATNQMNMKAEKATADDTYNAVQTSKEEPDVMVVYKELGYTVSKEADEKIDGTDCYTIKMTKKPQKVDGKDENNIEYYYFDKGTSALVMQKEAITSGSSKGTFMETYFSDYQEVNGVFIPFAMKSKMTGQPSAFEMTVTKAEANVTIDDKEFVFPG